MQKNWFCSFQTEKFLSIHSVSNHALTIIQRLSQCLPSPESPGFLNCCFLPGSSKEIISHNASLLLSPQGSLLLLPSWELQDYQSQCLHSPFPFLPLMFPSWELQGGDQIRLLSVGVGPDWGLDPGPYLILWPFLVSWSVPPMSPVGAWPSGESEH